MSRPIQKTVVDLRSSFAVVKRQTEALLRDRTNPPSMHFELTKLLIAVDTLLGLRCSAYRPELLDDVPPIETIPLPYDIEFDQNIS